QVIGGLEPAHPGELVELVQFLAAGFGHVEVERLRLVQPFLPSRGGFDQPARIGLEGGGIQLFQVNGHAVDALDAAVEVLEVVDHDRIPQIQVLEVGNQVRIYHGELAGQVRFDEQVLVVGLDARRDAGDVGDGGGRGDGKAVGVAHAAPDL